METTTFALSGLTKVEGRVESVRRSWERENYDSLSLFDESGRFMVRVTVNKKLSALPLRGKKVSFTGFFERVIPDGDSYESYIQFVSNQYVLIEGDLI